MLERIYEKLELSDLVVNGEKEIWKKINEVEELSEFRDWYWISSFGRVKSIGGRKDKILKQHDNGNGYLIVGLSILDGKKKKMLTHRLVALAFVSGYDDGLVCNHLDEDSKSNHYNNLEWVTHKENVNYGTAIERRVEKQSMAVIGKCLETGKTIRFSSTQGAHRSGFDQGAVSSACRGRYASHCKHGGTNIYKGYIWKYEKEEEENLND